MIAASFSSCIKQSFDNPPDASHQDPNLPTNVTIAQLAQKITQAGAGTSLVFTGDSTIYGVVTADDRSGNFYHQIVIQDSTGGIVIAIQATNLYNSYPVGRKVYVKLKGLTLVDYKGIPEIVFSATNSAGSLTLTGIPSALVTNYIVQASYPNTVTPLKVTFQEILHYGTAFMVNRLVEMDNMEFDSTSAGQTYALPSILSVGTNRTLHDCTPDSTGGVVTFHVTSSIIMYNSGYATFQPTIIPKGKGTLTGIYSVYNTTPQFLIRDTTDINFMNHRDCP